MNLSLIVAMDRNRCIGKGNTIPWHYKEDMQYFKRATTGHTVIMGRKTFDSIGKPLPNRINIVISRNTLEIPGVHVVASLQDALSIAQQNNDQEPFIIGGSEIYRLAEPQVTRLYITQILKEHDGDVFFPEFDMSKFDLIDSNSAVHPELVFSIYQKSV